MDKTLGDYRVYYNAYEGSLRIVRYIGLGGALRIPPCWQNMMVTSIGPGSFKDALITSVAIPRGVCRIYSNAFHSCSLLTSVTITPGLTSIGSFAFARCDNLTNIAIPDSVARIDPHAFYFCAKLKKVTLSKKTDIDGKSFPSHTVITRI